MKLKTYTEDEWRGRVTLCVEMNISKKCVGIEERSKVVPEIHFVAISVESTVALNPWCFQARVVYVHTPSLMQSHP